MSYLNAIARLAESNMSGVVSLQVVRKADVVAIPTPVLGVIYGDITFAAGGGLVAWQPTSQTINLQSSNSQTAHGNAKENVLPFVLPKDNPTIRRQLELAENDELIVVYADGNGKTKIFGSLDRPVRFRFDHDTGKDSGSRNGYLCEFYYSGPENNFFYEGTTPAPPASGAPVLVKWQNSLGIITIATAYPGEVVTINSDFDYTSFDITTTIV